MTFWKKLFWCLFVWKLPFAKDENLKDVDAIVTQAVSKLDDGTLGPGDGLLADAIERVYQMYPKKPIFAQDVVAEVLEQRNLPCIQNNKPKGESYAHSSFNWNTFEIARQQYELCSRNNWSKIAMVAMPDHVVRSWLAYRKVGFDDVRIVAADPEQIHYHHPNSLYWAMRGRRWRFLMRELCCKLLFLFTGRI